MMMMMMMLMMMVVVMMVRVGKHLVSSRTHLLSTCSMGDGEYGAAIPSWPSYDSVVVLDHP
jgi:hypothetical protein